MITIKTMTLSKLLILLFISGIIFKNAESQRKEVEKSTTKTGRTAMAIQESCYCRQV